MQTKDRSYVLFVLPGALILLVLTVVPVILLFTFSLTSWTLIRPGSFQFGGLDNFIRIFHEDRALNSIQVTFYYILVNTSIQMVLGFLFAYLLYAGRKGTRILRSFLLVPMLIPPVVVGLAWRVLFTPDLGGINYLLRTLGVAGPDWLAGPATALAAVTIASVWEWTPFVMLVLLAGLESLPTDPIESALIDGANVIQRVRLVILPLLMPVILVVIILRVIEALGILPVVFMMTGGGPAQATEAINLYAYEVGFTFLDIAYASSLLVIFIFIILIFAVPFVLTTFRKA